MSTGADFAAAASLLSRLPLPAAAFKNQGQGSRCLRFAPAVGVAIGLLGCLPLIAGSILALPPFATAALASAVGVLATGGLHEDGLADVADGFGGGRTSEAKLAIMRDSRIGTFGTIALCLALVLRIATVASLLQALSVTTTCGLVLAGAAISRGAMLMPLQRLPFARQDGLARAVGALSLRTLVEALLLAGGVAFVATVALPVGIVRMAVALAAALAVGQVMTVLAKRQIGGVTGDVIGATQQIAELAILLTFAAGR